MPSPDTAKGRLIVLEGVDAAGKTTQTARLAERLGAVATFQFGATPLGAEIRRLVLNPPGGGLDPNAEALLIAADKAQHLAETVAPALATGRHVVSDRFTASMLAYQGYGRGLPLGPLTQVLEFSVGGFEPDLNILLDVEPAAAVQRRPEAADRFEQLGSAFADRVRRGYLALADAAPHRWAVINAAPPVEQVADEIAAVVNYRFGLD